MSDTPLTDAIDAANGSLSAPDAYAMMRSHARRLERELAEEYERGREDECDSASIHEQNSRGKYGD